MLYNKLGAGASCFKKKGIFLFCKVGRWENKEIGKAEHFCSKGNDKTIWTTKKHYSTAKPMSIYAWHEFYESF